MAKTFTVTENYSSQLPESKIPGRLLINSNGNLHYDIDEETRLSLGGGGTKTNEGGEVFNDTPTNMAIAKYTTAMGTNNIAGMKAFKITGVTKTSDNIGTYTLEDVNIPQTEWDYDIVTKHFEKLGTVEIFALNESNPFVATINNLDNVSFNDINNSIMCEVVDGQPTGDIYGTLIMESDQVNNWDSNRSCTVDTDKGLTLSDVGRKFDVYKNGYALSVGDLYTIELSGHYTDCGVITNIVGNVVSVEGRVYETGTTLPEVAYFNVIDKPLCGTITPNCGGAFVTGWGNIAGRLGSFATGYANIAASRYSFASGQGNRVGVYSSASGVDNKATGHAVLVSGMNNNVPGWYDTVSGVENDVKSNYNVVSGKGNLIHRGYGAALLAGTNNVIGTDTLPTSDINGAVVCGSYNISTQAHSVVFGYNNTNDSARNLIFGGTNETKSFTNTSGTYVDSEYSLIGGVGNKCAGKYSTTIGYMNKSCGQNSFNIGTNNILGTFDSSEAPTGRHDNTTLIGSNLKSYASNFFAIGKFNNPNWTLEFGSPIFQIGRGNSDTDRKNAFQVNSVGQAFLPMISENDIGTSNNAIATKGYVDNSLIQTGTTDPVTAGATSKYYIQILAE